MDDGDAWIDETLRSYPLAEPPRGFSSRVMAEIRSSRARSVPEIRFRLEFLDLAIAFFFALFGALGFVAVLWVYARLDPLLLLELRFLAIAAAASLPIEQVLIWGFGLAGVGLMLAGGVGGLLLWQSPRTARVRLKA